MGATFENAEFSRSTIGWEESLLRLDCFVYRKIRSNNFLWTDQDGIGLQRAPTLSGIWTLTLMFPSTILYVSHTHCSSSPLAPSYFRANYFLSMIFLRSAICRQSFVWRDRTKCVAFSLCICNDSVHSHLLPNVSISDSVGLILSLIFLAHPFRLP